MKIKVTKKQIMKGYYNIICTGYCNLQALLNYVEPDYYTCGVYGWNSDVYKINNNTCIVTGYRPFGNIRNYDLVKKYEQKAEKIIYNNDLDYEVKKKKLNKLLDKFVKETLENAENAVF